MRLHNIQRNQTIGHAEGNSAKRAIVGSFSRIGNPSTPPGAIKRAVGLALLLFGIALHFGQQPNVAPGNSLGVVSATTHSSAMQKADIIDDIIDILKDIINPPPPPPSGGG